MATSFVEYRQAGFWAPDDTMRVWLSALAASVGDTESLPAWLRSANERWRQYAKVGCPGCISCGLDEYAHEEERRVVMLQTAERALLLVPQKDWTPPVRAKLPREKATALGLMFLLLLRGELKTYVGGDLGYVKFL